MASGDRECLAKLDRDQVLALKAEAFDRLLTAIPCVRNPDGNPAAVDRAREILALPVPPPAPAPQETSP